MIVAMMLVGLVNQKAGDEITVPVGTYAAVDYPAALKMAQCLAAKDGIGMRKLIEARKIREIMSPSPALVLEEKSNRPPFRSQTFRGAGAAMDQLQNDALSSANEAPVHDFLVVRLKGQKDEVYLLAVQFREKSAQARRDALAAKIAAATGKERSECLNDVDSIRHEYRSAHDRVFARNARKGLQARDWAGARADIAKKYGVPVAIVDEIGATP